MRRVILGIVSLLLIVGGVASLVAMGGGEQERGMLASAVLRAGVILGAIWLAMPQLERLFQRFPPWLMAGAAIGFVILVVRPRLILYVAPLLVAMAALQWLAGFFRAAPRKPRPPARRPPPAERRSDRT